MHPVLFEVPWIHLPIYSYGVMLGLSLVVGWYIVMYLGGRDGFPKETLANCFLWTAVAAIAGARILYIIVNFGEFEGKGLIAFVNLRTGGLVAYGGFLGGYLGSWAYMRSQGIRLLPWADIVVPTLGSGLGITRIGCFLYGCDFGKRIPESAAAWIKAIGVRFPNWSVRFPELSAEFQQKIGCMKGSFSGSPAFNEHVVEGLVGRGDPFSLPVYPTQLFEVANGWIAFALVMLFRPYTRWRGQAFLIFTAYYGATRTLMELFRGDQQRGGIGPLSTSQLVGIATLIASGVAWYFLSRQAKRDPAAAMALGPGIDGGAAAGKGEKSRGARTKSRKKR